MSLFVDQSYIGMMGNYLPLFSAKKGNLYNFRCPICGDSTKNPYKKRAYFYVNDSGDSFNFVCHNCGASHSLYTFMTLKFPEYAKQYRFEKFVSTGSGPKVLEKAIPMRQESVLSFDNIDDEKSESEDSVFDDLIPVDILPRDHKARKYLQDERLIEENLLQNFLYVDDFSEWYQKIDSEKKYPKHSRIVIPYLNEKDEIYRMVCRSFDSAYGPKYIYVDLEDGNQIFNFYRLNFDKRVYLVEGQIDSIILPNSAAIGNAKYDKKVFTDFEDYVIIPDNEPRNPQIVASIKKAIESGHPVCIWQKNLGKDINAMIQNGHSIEEIKKLIDASTFSRVTAKLKFDQWRKV